jgi:integrase
VCDACTQCCRRPSATPNAGRSSPATPPSQADPPKQAGPGEIEQTTWTAAELRAFLEGVAGDELYPLWLLLATTGMRRGEALGLRWTDVDLEAGRLAVRQTIVAVGHAVEVSTPKTKRGRRSVALDGATVATLRAHRKAQLETRMAWGAARVDKDLVFTRGDGEWLHPERVSKLFAQAIAAAELPSIRLHDLRHTHATLGLAAGVPAKVMSDRLGHATVAFTLDTYTHAVPALEEEAAETVARLVLG